MSTGKIYRSGLFVVSLLLMLSGYLHAQTFGTIFTSDEAYVKFGPVLDSVVISTDVVNALMKQTTGVMMFNIENGKLTILGANRVVLYPKEAVVPDSVVFHSYSISQIVELEKKGEAKNLQVEARKSVLSISNGTFVMEIGAPCPPYCYETLGTLFTAEKANELYGKVLTSVSMKTDELTALLDKAGSVIMFNIEKGKVQVLGSNRVVLVPAGADIPASTVFTVYSSGQVKLLLTQGGAAETFIEQRQNVLTITNGATTMEIGAPCPPYCY
ncbi:MAG: hypothetical protein LWX56_02045 [Ignavibacteria bacterium]|nr:hypothetical protein [Ignavibacteria bacterium]